MSIKHILAQGTIVGIPVADTITNNGIITALGLEEMVWMGFTYGALFKIAMFFSLVVIIVLNLTKVVKELVQGYQSIKKIWNTGKKSTQLEEERGQVGRREDDTE